MAPGVTGSNPVVSQRRRTRRMLWVRFFYGDRQQIPKERGMAVNKKEKASYVGDVFNTIAPSYDRMNLLMTWGMLPIWQKRVMKLTSLSLGGRGIDLCCGTGEMAWQMAEIVGPFGEVVGLDFSSEMLVEARAKAPHKVTADVRFVQGDALDTGLAGNSFDAATSGFALRNVTDIPKAIEEMARLVRPGGRVVCIEVSRPSFPLSRLFFNQYYYRFVPWLGEKLVSNEVIDGNYSPYAWLAESLRHFPDRKVIRSYFKDAGLLEVKARPVGFGAVTIYSGTKPNREERLMGQPGVPERLALLAKKAGQAEIHPPKRQKHRPMIPKNTKSLPFSLWLGKGRKLMQPLQMILQKRLEQGEYSSAWKTFLKKIIGLSK